MELVFQETQVDYLQSVVCEQICQEETGEAIVPDSSPDMEKIVDSFATVLLRSKDCQTGVLTAACGANVGVVYTAEGEGQPRLISVYLPFNVRKTSDAIAPDSLCCVACSIRSVDARMLNSRKLTVRVTVCCSVQIWNRGAACGYTAVEPPSMLQLRPAVYPLQLPVDYAEKQITLRDAIPGPQPEAARILRAGAVCELSEQRMLGSRAVFKGNFRLQLLYESREGALCSCELPVAFSQFCEFGQDYDEQPLELTPVFDTVQVEPGEDGMLEIELGLCMQCCVQALVKLPVLEDAYCTSGQLELRWQEYALQPQLDQRVLTQPVREEIPAQAREVVDCAAWAEPPEVVQADGVSRITVPVRVQALYLDPEGQYQGASARFTAELQAPAGAQSCCRAGAWLEGPVFAAAGAERIEVRFTVGVCCRWYDGRTCRSICGGTLEPGEPEAERPAVIIRTLPQDCSFWELAKELRTTVSAIQIANDMEQEEQAEAGTMLLIPIVA